MKMLEKIQAKAAEEEHKDEEEEDGFDSGKRGRREKETPTPKDP